LRKKLVFIEEKERKCEEYPFLLEKKRIGKLVKRIRN
jgi:hypothetical protein